MKFRKYKRADRYDGRSIVAQWTPDGLTTLDGIVIIAYYCIFFERKMVETSIITRSCCLTCNVHISLGKTLRNTIEK